MKKRPFDIVATFAIGLAALAGVVYIGPWLLFDVFGLGKSNTSNLGMENGENEAREDFGLSDEKRVSLSLDENEMFNSTLVSEMESETAVNLIDEEVFRSLNWYRTLQKIAQVVENQPVTPDATKISRVIPAVDPNWDREGTWVMVPKIGLETQIQPTEKVGIEAALEKGVIRIEEYGQPGDKGELPMILAAHRFGYQWWWKEPGYGQKHSFYYLPELTAGDIVQVVDNEGRRWYYEIYATTEGEKIDDYGSDLIMYTCKFLNSSQRYFQYARLIDPALYGNYPGTELGAGTEIEYVEEVEKQIEIKDKVITDEEGRTWVRM